jgi:hypothetical protein
MPQKEPTLPAQFWESVLNAPGVGAGTPLASSTTLTDISAAPQLVLPANWLYANQRLRLTAYGIYSTTGAPTLLLGGYYGGVAGTLLAATAANATATGAASFPWRFYLDIYVRTLGSSGSVWCNGRAEVGSSLTAYTVYALPSSQTQPITINTTTANALTIGAQWGTNSASNAITCEDAYIEAAS